ncbi:MAG: hypothetical protein BGO39_03405 [Chloroflexi bacterium 54-19]|nr:MAG: hypothetical protein BGO39_03405 [Chloroflexi bacterium 54-19]
MVNLNEIFAMKAIKLLERKTTGLTSSAVKAEGFGASLGVSLITVDQDGGGLTFLIAFFLGSGGSYIGTGNF